MTKDMRCFVDLGYVKTILEKNHFNIATVTFWNRIIRFKHVQEQGITIEGLGQIIRF